MGDLTANFSTDEFRCKDGSFIPGIYVANVKRLAENLQVLRDVVNAPIHINSGYRSKAYNKKIGGASASQHMFATAADIVVRGMRPSRVAELIEELIREGKMVQGGLGRYSSFTHYDIRGQRARW